MKKQDIILIIGILATAVAVLVCVSLLSGDGAEVVIRLEGEELARYPLDVDATYSLCGGENTLVIEGGEAYLSDATCPDLLCVKRGRISRTGETIICLPHRLTITVVGDSDKNGKNDVDIST